MAGKSSLPGALQLSTAQRSAGCVRSPRRGPYPTSSPFLAEHSDGPADHLYRTGETRFRAALVALGLGLGLGLAGCAELDRPEDVVCPPGGTELTWEEFAEPFFESHCQSCHAREARRRNGAPPEVTFDRREEVLAWRERIFARAAAGNTSMPPGPDGPSAEERELLAEWLACVD